MKISLWTDAPQHNLALMKVSSWAKMEGHEVSLNMPLWQADYVFASILFTKNRKKFIADFYGGPGLGCISVLPPDIEKCKPDYDLFPAQNWEKLDYSLGYTYRYCPRNCPFCVVPRIEIDKNHYSIWTFHDPKFRKICLLNNNTFADRRWRETFEEIWAEDLIVRDQNGYDLRLMDEEKAQALKKTRWSRHSPRFSWDRMEDEKEIITGLKEINKVGFRRCTIYVLTGFKTSIEEDIYRCQRIHDLGHDPYPMIYDGHVKNPMLNKFRIMIYGRYYRKEGNIEKAWREYRENKRRHR